MVAFVSSLVFSALSLSALAIPMPDAGAKSFTKQNGEAAIILNNGFATLSPNDSCTPGQNACIKGEFAQCPNGKFVVTSCAAGTTCVALPLVNSVGTSITCSTEADKNARIAATGATGPSSSNLVNAAQAPPAAAASPSSPAASLSSAPASSKPFTLQNGKDAQALNAQFAGLTPDSPCTAGQNACVDNEFAQCVNGKFVLTACGGGLQCNALPLVNTAGTSITCVDKAQAQERIAATGAGTALTRN